MEEETSAVAEVDKRLGLLSLVKDDQNQFFHAVIDNMIERETSIDGFGAGLEPAIEAYANLFSEAVGRTEGGSTKDKVKASTHLAPLFLR